MLQTQTKIHYEGKPFISENIIPRDIRIAYKKKNNTSEQLEKTNEPKRIFNLRKK